MCPPRGWSVGAPRFGDLDKGRVARGTIAPHHPQALTPRAHTSSRALAAREGSCTTRSSR
eukprot:520864-Prymnesium_polylepis.2